MSETTTAQTEMKQSIAPLGAEETHALGVAAMQEFFRRLQEAAIGQAEASLKTCAA